MNYTIKPIARGMRVSGQAVTVLTRPGDALPGRGGCEGETMRRSGCAGGDEVPGRPSLEELAQRLYIPDEMWAEIEKKDRDEVNESSRRVNRSLGILFCVLGGFLLVNQLDSQWTWLGLLGVVFINYLPNQIIKKGCAAAQQAREKAQRRYAALYYCRRDDLVFSRTRFCPLRRMR